MSPRSKAVYLADILESIHQINTYIGDKTEFEFSTDMLLQDAIMKAI